MSIFGDIMNKIVSAVSGTSDSPAATDATEAAASSPTTEATPTETHSPMAMSEVDVEQVLSNMADQQGGSGNWRTSIVDLLKLLELPSSLDARKQLADELDVHEGAPGSTEENIALHRAVMAKLEENGGKVPDSLKG
jgi:hypothetical protein